MADIRAFVPSVQAAARLCPVPTIKEALAQSAADFCRRSFVWRLQVSIDLVAGTDLYTITMPSGSSVGTVELVSVLGITVPAWPHPWPQDSAQCRIPSFYGIDQDNGIRLYPVPSDSVSGGLVVSVIAEPDASGGTLPDFLLQRFKDDIVSGALGSIMAMVGQPWANPQVALYHQKKFRSAIGSARIAAMRASSVASTGLSTKPIV